MTVTGYVESTAEMSMMIPSMETKCDMNSQHQSNEEMKKNNSAINYENNHHGDSEAFVNDNNQILSKSLVDGLKIEIVTNQMDKKKSYSDDNLLKHQQHDDDDDDDDVHNPPDGGFRAWTIMIGSFFINGILFGIINSYSLIYPSLSKILEDSGETDVSVKASLVGSLTIGTTFLLSPIAGILTDKMGIRMTTLVGGTLAFSGLFLSSIFSTRVEILYLTYGVMYGLGASLAYTPSLAILGHYFKRYLGLVNGVVTAGSSVFTIIMPEFMKYLLENYGLIITFRCLAFLTLIVVLCASLFKPISVSSKKTTTKDEKKNQNESTFKSIMSAIVDTSIWRRKRYVVWATSIPLALFGYFVPYVHIGNFVKLVFDGESPTLPLMCIGISSGIGRLVFGYIADIPRVNRILLQQISFISIGLLTMLLPFSPPHWYILLVITLLMGLFDGCFISLLGPIAFDICGRNGATQAIGFLLGLCSFPLTIGPPVAAFIFEKMKSYTLPFVLAGVPPLIGAVAMCLVRFVKDDSKEECVVNGNRNNGKTRDGTTVNYKQLTTKRVDNIERLQKSEGFSYSNPPHAVNKKNFFNYSNDNHRYSNCNKCVVISESVPLLWKIH